MVTSNPLLKREDSFVGTEQASMTLNGTVNKTGILLVLCVVTACFGWNAGDAAGAAIAIGALGGLVFSLIGCFVPKTSPFVAPLYAVCEGLCLGAVSALYNAAHPGIAAIAVLAAFSVLGIFLFLYATRIVRVTAGMVTAIVAATAGVFFVYLIDMIATLFHHPLGILNGAGPLGIIISLIVCGIAAFNFFIDFASIEGRIRAGAPKYMEWYCGMALLITLVWLYLEILRLLSRLQRR